MKTIRMATVVASLVAVAMVLVIGAGCHAMGLRHGGAHCLVEAVAAFLVTWPASAILLLTRRAA